MSTEEKETYFDGPHMSLGDAQPYHPRLQQRFPSPEASTHNFEAHSSNHMPGLSDQNPTNSVVAINDSMKSSAPFQHFNGRGPPMSFQPLGQAPPAVFFVPPTIHPPSEVSPNEQPDASEQPSREAVQIADVSPAALPPNFSVAVNEALSTSQPMGTYMNIAQNIDQQMPMSVPQENVAAPPSQVSAAEALDNNVSNVRSNAFDIHPGPLFASGLHQDLSEDRSRRNAEDILHSQGSWPSQCFTTSASDYPVHQPQYQLSGAVSVPNEELSNPPEVAESTAEQLPIEPAMNNLAISDNPPVPLDDLNIEADLDDTSSSSTNSDEEDAVPFEEKVLVAEKIDGGVPEFMISQSEMVAPSDISSHNTSTLHPPIDDSSTAVDVATSQPPISGDAPLSTAAPCPSSIREHPLHILPVETHASNHEHETLEPPFDQRESDTKSSLLSDASQAPPHPGTGDAFILQPIQMQISVENQPTNAIAVNHGDSAVVASTAAVVSQATPPPRLGSEDIGNQVVDTQSMHSSYVSVQPPVEPFPTTLFQPPTVVTTVAAPASAPPSSLTTQPIDQPSPSGGLRSQMVLGENGRAPLHPEKSYEHVAPGNPPAQLATSRSVPTTQATNPPAPSISSYPPFQTTAPSAVISSTATNAATASASFISAPDESHPPSSEPHPSSSYHQMQYTHPKPEQPSQTNFDIPPSHKPPEPQIPPASYHNQPPQFKAFVEASLPGPQPEYQRPSMEQAQAHFQPSEQSARLPLSVHQQTEQNRQYSSIPHQSSDPNIQRSTYMQWDRRHDPTHRVPSRPHSSMSGAEPSYAPAREGWHNRNDNYGQPREDRYVRDPYNQRWPPDQRSYDSYYRSYGNYAYTQRGYYRDYDPYYRQQRAYAEYYDRHQYYDQYGRPYRDQWAGYYPSYYGGHYYDDNEDRRSVYSERSAHHRHNETYNSSYQDVTIPQGHPEEASFNDSYYSNACNDVAYQPLPEVLARRTPAKFSCAHSVARFGAGGYLVVLMPQQSAEQASSSLQLHSMETLLQNTHEAESLKKFPGPLSKSETHKNDVVQFITSQSRKCSRNTSLVDRQSASLVWDFLALMVRQNGAVMGTDSAELLMKDHSGDFGLLASPNETQKRAANTQDGALAESGSDSRSHLAPEYAHAGSEHVCPSVRFRELLLYGRKKDALEWAMKSNLWGHALLLASKTDNRTHATVMLQFANSLAINDPLQTLYQLMSGRQPASTTWVASEGWGDWRPHLAMILSNSTENASLDAKLLLTMGDTLWTRDLIDAAHFCYLMAPAPLGFYVKKSAKLVLIGSSHKRPFKEFATNEAIQRTETYEYATALSSSTRQPSRHPVHFPPFQIYKFIYACRLLDYGMVAKAFHYFENIARLVIQSPSAYSLTLVRQLSAMVEHLRLHDFRLQAGTLRDSGLEWARTLNNVLEKMAAGSIIQSTTTYARSSSLSDVASSGVLTESHHHPEMSDESDQSDDEVTDEEQLAKYDAGSHHQPRQEPSNRVWQQPSYDQQQPSYNQQQAMIATIPAYSTLSHQAAPQPRLNEDHLQVAPHLTKEAQVSSLAFQPPPTFQIDPQLSQASIPSLVSSSQASLQPTMNQHPTQYQSTPNSSIVPTMPSPPGEPQQDFYDHVSNKQQVDLAGGSRVRTESQTSFGSRRSRLSKRSSGRRTRTVSERSKQSRSRSASAESEKKPMKKEKHKKGWGWLGWFSKSPDKPKVHHAHLPDDSNKGIQWDPKLNRWVDTNASEEEEQAPPKPPPMDAPGYDASNVSQAPPGSAALTPNRFSLKNLSGRSMYKNAFSGSTTSASNTVMPPPVLPASSSSVHQTANPPTMFTPASVAPSSPAAEPVGGEHTSVSSVPAEAAPMNPAQPMHQPEVARPDTRLQNMHQYEETKLMPPGIQPPHTSQRQLNSSQLSSVAQPPPMMYPQAALPPHPTAPLDVAADAQVASDANEVAQPRSAPFYNPAQFASGPNLFAQPSISTQRKRAYPTVKQ